MDLSHLQPVDRTYSGSHGAAASGFRNPELCVGSGGNYLPLSAANEALERLRSGNLRGAAVLVNA